MKRFIPDHDFCTLSIFFFKLHSRNTILKNKVRCFKIWIELKFHWHSLIIKVLSILKFMFIYSFKVVEISNNINPIYIHELIKLSGGIENFENFFFRGFTL